MIMVNKNNWKEVKIGDYVDHIEVNERNPDKRKDAKFVSVEHTSILDLRINGVASEEQPSFNRTFKTGQILFAKRWAISTPYPSKIAVAHFDGICSPHLWALETKSGLLQSLLPFILQTNSFFEYANMNSAGSLAGVYLKWEPFSQYKFKLPPPVDQKQMSDLFESIVAAMEQVEGQEKNLKSLWLRLINDFVSDNPSFGNLIKEKKLQTVNYSDVTKKIMRRISPESYGIEKIIGGEHLNAEDFKIRTWDTVGIDPLGPAFHVLFQPGDILYGSRRTYLKKVAFAEFEGVCANTTYVIRANEELLLQDLLKHIMLSERFTQYSIGVSKGSTNPYINWKDLDNFSFQIPDIETQKEIVKVLDSIIEIREQLKQQKATLKNLKQKLLNEILG